MALFGNKQNKCILCNRNIGSYYHATAEERFLCDRCATECGYENLFFQLNGPETLTLGRLQNDHAAFEAKQEENKQQYKAFDITKRFDKFLYLDTNKLQFYTPSALMCGTKTPIVYLYKQVQYIQLSLIYGDEKKPYRDSEGLNKAIESVEGYNLPVVDDVQVMIKTTNPYKPTVRISILDETVRKPSKEFEKAINLGNEIYEAFSSIIFNNR